MPRLPKIEYTFAGLRYCLRIKRFIDLIQFGKPDECWEWQGSRNKDGYGNCKWVLKGIRSAHVVAYELFVGSRHGKCVCHSCDNPPCCNPSHLWRGTHKQNMEDRDIKGRGKLPSNPEHFGSDNPKSKVNNRKAKKIRRLYFKKHKTQTYIAEKFSISQSTV